MCLPLGYFGRCFMRLFLSLALVLTGCGSGSTTGSSRTKALLSSWTSTTPTSGIILDFSSCVSGVNSPMKYYTINGNECACTANLIISGNSASTSYFSCTYVAATGTGSDPGCAGVDGTGTCVVTNGVMQCCQGGCTSYR